MSESLNNMDVSTEDMMKIMTGELTVDMIKARRQRDAIQKERERKQRAFARRSAELMAEYQPLRTNVLIGILERTKDWNRLEIHEQKERYEIREAVKKILASRDEYVTAKRMNPKERRRAAAMSARGQGKSKNR